MEERRIRRSGRAQTLSLLPVETSESRSRHLPNTISCWYCDYKISALNGVLFRFGRRNANFFKIWFSIGVGFTLTALLTVTMILVWELGIALHIFGGSTELKDALSSFLFGFSPPAYAFSLSLADAAYLLLSTLISVSVHELGHAIAAASEGIQMEYIAIFAAVIFPGALVAFNYELLQMLQQFAVLRVYCAGIWHNVVCCAVCALVLFLLPSILSPFYMHTENPMVLELPSSSPLSGYLYPGDVIVSVDAKRIHNEQEWRKTNALIHEKALQSSKHLENSKGMAISGKGYCVPTSLFEESEKINLVDNQSGCPNDLTEFIAIQCCHSSELDDVRIADGHPNRTDDRHCLNERDVVRLNKCGHGWLTETTSGSTCSCSQDESCLSPIQFPGMPWVEITYSSSYSPQCLQLGKNTSPGSGSAELVENCGGTFVFVGDVISMAYSIQFAAYLPRWAFPFSAFLPKVLEKNIMCTFQVSFTVALLNSLPVYFLDGESILEAALCHFTSLGARKRAKILQGCRMGLTVFCIIAFVRIFFVSS